jgi:hypothetical protein
MVNSRRNFLRGLSLIVAAPAVVKAESLMNIVVPKHNIVTIKSSWSPQFLRGDGMWINAETVQDVLSKHHLNDESFLSTIRLQWAQESGNPVIYQTHKQGRILMKTL